MKNKIAILIYLIAFGALIYWAYPIIKERYFSAEDSGPPAEQAEKVETKDENGSIAPENETIPTENSDGKTIIEPPATPNAFLEISRSDCESECAYFSKEDEKKYCMEACGLSTPTKPEDNGCDPLSGLEKDYCWKTEAIEKTDFSICKKIEDSKIREVCQNRVTEDIIDKQKID